MMKLVVAVCALICVANAASIKWTGLAQNNQWTSTVNWYPAQVPGPNDDVTIETGSVQVTISTGVNSLTMGTSVDGMANLTIFQSFVVASTMDVDVNGNLFLNAGTASLQGTVTVKGHLYLQSGTIGGQLTVTQNGIADLSGQATKNLIGAGFTNQGNVVLSGVLNFNQSSLFTNQGSIAASGFVQLMAGDATATVFDSSAGSFSYNGGSGGKLRIAVTSHFKTIQLQSGDVTTVGQVDFADDILVPSGSTVKTEAGANTTFAGTLHGEGALNVGGKVTTVNAVNLSTVAVTVGYVYFNGAVIANTLTINAGTTQFNNNSQVGTFTIVSGNVEFASTVSASNANVKGGILTGAGGFSASTSASFASQGINLGTTFTLSGTMSFNSKTLIAYATGGNIVINSGASVTVGSPLALTGPPGSGAFTNNGAVAVNSGIATANINLLGSGSYTVAGTITTSSCKFTAGTVTINGGSVTGQTTALNIAAVADANTSGDVKVQVGNYHFACPSQCKNIDSQSSGQTYTFSA
jgi:cytoskeletal protein CcmA (bactofilin family)